MPVYLRLRYEDERRQHNEHDYLTDDNYADASNKISAKLSLTGKHRAKERPQTLFIVIPPVSCKANPQISIVQVSHLQQSQNMHEISDIPLNPLEADKCNCHKSEILKHLTDSTNLQLHKLFCELNLCQLGTNKPSSLLPTTHYQRRQQID